MGGGRSLGARALLALISAGAAQAEPLDLEKDELTLGFI